MPFSMASICSPIALSSSAASRRSRACPVRISARSRFWWASSWRASFGIRMGPKIRSRKNRSARGRSVSWRSESHWPCPSICSARWGDRPSWALEERLSHLFRELQERALELDQLEEERRAAAERAAEAARQEAEERERAWHVLMQEAEARAQEARRIAQLGRQADAWEEVCRLTAYCRAIEDAHGGDPSVEPWIAWIRDYVAKLDPLSERPVLPVTVDSTPNCRNTCRLGGAWRGPTCVRDGEDRQHIGGAPSFSGRPRHPRFHARSRRGPVSETPISPAQSSDPGGFAGRFLPQRGVRTESGSGIALTTTSEWPTQAV